MYGSRVCSAALVWPRSALEGKPFQHEREPHWCSFGSIPGAWDESAPSGSCWQLLDPGCQLQPLLQTLIRSNDTHRTVTRDLQQQQQQKRRKQLQHSDSHISSSVRNSDGSSSHLPSSTSLPRSSGHAHSRAQALQQDAAALSPLGDTTQTSNTPRTSALGSRNTASVLASGNPPAARTSHQDTLTAQASQETSSTLEPRSPLRVVFLSDSIDKHVMGHVCESLGGTVLSQMAPEGKRHWGGRRQHLRRRLGGPSRSQGIGKSQGIVLAGSKHVAAAQPSDRQAGSGAAAGSSSSSSESSDSRSSSSSSSSSSESSDSRSSSGSSDANLKSSSRLGGGGHASSSDSSSSSSSSGGGSRVVRSLLGAFARASGPQSGRREGSDSAGQQRSGADGVSTNGEDGSGGSSGGSMPKLVNSYAVHTCVGGKGVAGEGVWLLASSGGGGGTGDSGNAACAERGGQGREHITDQQGAGAEPGSEPLAAGLALIFPGVHPTGPYHRQVRHPFDSRLQQAAAAWEGYSPGVAPDIVMTSSLLWDVARIHGSQPALLQDPAGLPLAVLRSWAVNYTGVLAFAVRAFPQARLFAAHTTMPPRYSPTTGAMERPYLGHRTHLVQLNAALRYVTHRLGIELIDYEQLSSRWLEGQRYLADLIHPGRNVSLEIGNILLNYVQQLDLREESQRLTQH
ncbi:MAG: hypothetical protein WDW38_011486 [Sanguina aurantia]